MWCGPMYLMYCGVCFGIFRAQQSRIPTLDLVVQARLIHSLRSTSEEVVGFESLTTFVIRSRIRRATDCATVGYLTPWHLSSVLFAVPVLYNWLPNVLCLLDCWLNFWLFYVYAPDLTTSETGIFASWAINPIIEKITKPPNTLVPSATNVIRIESL
jgi:hypothetical protein